MRFWIPSLLLSFFAGTVHSADPVNLHEKVIATVNSREILGKDLQLEFFQKQLTAAPSVQTHDQLIQKLIDRELIKQFLKKRKVAAEQVLIDERMNAIRKLVESKGDDLDKILGSLGLHEEAVEEMIALQLAWRAHVTRTLTEKRIQEFWEQHKSHFDGTEVRASQIFKRVPSGTNNTEAVKFLDELRRKIDGNEAEFAKAAKLHSDSPSSAKGGELGSFEFYGRVSEPIAEAAFETEAGKISKPFESPFGVHIVMVHERTNGDYSLEDARPQIVKVLSNVLWDEQIARERKNARIRLAE